MALTAVNFITKGPVLHADLLQFYNLFTGVMLDQPVTFKNVLTLGGNQGAATVPFKVYGAIGQTTHLIDLYADTSQAQPGFGFGAAGNFGWGPGGASPQDTFLSRVGTQNGHATDTAGLYVTPYLEVGGPINAVSYQYANGASITGPGANPLSLVLNQDLTVNRNVTAGGNMSVVGGFLYLHDANNGIRSDGSNVAIFTSGSVFLRNPGDTQYVNLEVANIDIRSPGGSTAISWGDGSHYLQYAPAGNLSLLAWTHNFQCNEVDVFNGNLRLFWDGSYFVITSPSAIKFMDQTNVSYRQIRADEFFGQSINLQGGNGNNQVIYWRDASHYLQYAPAGATNLLAWTHDFQCQTLISAASQIRYNGSVLAIQTSGGGVGNLNANDLNCQSVSIIQGSNRVIYFGDGSHYVQYDNASRLYWTHNWQAGGTITGNGAYINSASYRDLKHDILTLDPQLCRDRVDRLAPVSFFYNDPDMEGQRLGFVIEDVAPVVPQAVDPDGLRSEALISVLWGAVRELSAQVRALQGAAA